MNYVDYYLKATTPSQLWHAWPWRDENGEVCLQYDTVSAAVVDNLKGAVHVNIRMAGDLPEELRSFQIEAPQQPKLVWDDYGVGSPISEETL